jgi:hypothetical protein
LEFGHAVVVVIIILFICSHKKYRCSEQGTSCHDPLLNKEQINRLYSKINKLTRAKTAVLFIVSGLV